MQDCFGTNRDGLLFETRKVYSFGSSGANIITVMNAAVDLLIKSGKVKIVDEKLVICKEEKS